MREAPCVVRRGPPLKLIKLFYRIYRARKRFQTP